MIDETVIDKSNTIEKLKSIATAKTMSVSQKFVQHYSVPFFGKVIICTNKETDFMKIDDEEIRFWVRKINVINGKRNTLIEEQLRDEIPKFLKLLINLPEIDFSKSRMVFTEDEIQTNALDNVKKESKTGLTKDLLYYIEDLFMNNNITEFEATPIDIKKRWFLNDSKVTINYIRRILKDELKINPSEPKKYNPFAGIDTTGGKNELNITTGRTFTFTSKNMQVIENELNNIFDDVNPF